MKAKQTFLKELLALSCTTVMLSGCGTDTGDAGLTSLSTEESAENNDAATGIQGASPEDIPDDASSPSDEQPNQDKGTDDGEETAPDTTESTVPGQAEAKPAESDAAQASRDLYEEFLHNGFQAVVRDDFPKYEYEKELLQRGSAYTLTELGQAVSDYYLYGSSYDSMQYAYIQCLDSDAQKLLIRFNGLDIYSPDDDSYAVFILSQDDGHLYLTNKYACWARSSTSVCLNGQLSDYSSNGAGDHFAGLSAILSDGKKTDICMTETLSGEWTNLGGEAYHEIFGTDHIPGLVVSFSAIGDDKYYCYDLSECSGEDLSLCETYVERCRDELGINWVSSKEVEAAVRDRCTLLGINYDELMQSEEVSWSSLPQ